MGSVCYNVAAFLALTHNRAIAAARENEKETEKGSEKGSE